MIFLRIIKSFGYAGRGLKQAWKDELNFRIIFKCDIENDQILSLMKILCSNYNNFIFNSSKKERKL